jgi:TRAP-type mannitol/chloroaromatic compound transport system substrate-binding protein
MIRKAAMIFSLAMMLSSTTCVEATTKRKTSSDPSPKPGSIEWRVQSTWQSEEFVHRLFEEFCEKVKRITDGKLVIRPLPVGAAAPMDKMLEALKGDRLQGIFSWPGYFAGKNQAFAPISDLIFAYEQPWEIDAFMQFRGGLDFLRQCYKQFEGYTVGTVVLGRRSWASKLPLERLEDLRGVRIREVQGLEADFMVRAGARVMFMSLVDTIPALEKGVLDAVSHSSLAANDEAGFHKHASFLTYPGFHSIPVADFTVATGAWKSLPQDLKELLECAVRDWSWQSVHKFTFEDMRTAQQALQKGKKLVSWSHEEVEKARQMARGVWEDWKKKGDQARMAVELQEKWLRELGRIK